MNLRYRHTSFLTAGHAACVAGVLIVFATLGLRGQEESGGFRLFELQESNAISPYTGPVLPSFSYPEVMLMDPQFGNVKWEEDGGASCGMRISGVVFSRAAKLLGRGDAPFPQGYVYVNGSLLEGAGIPVEWATPDGPSAEVDSGNFSATIRDIPLTEGVNVVEFVFPDPVTRAEGSQAVSFSILAEADDRSDVPKIEEPSRLPKGDGGECHPYLLGWSASQPDDPKPVSLELGSGDQVRTFDFQEMGGTGVYLLHEPEAAAPLRFFLLPSREPVDPEHLKALSSRCKSARFTEGAGDRLKFLAGYSAGNFLSGADMIYRSGTTIPGIAQVSRSNGMLTLEAAISYEAGEKAAVKISVPAGYQEGSFEPGDTPEIPTLMWEISRLYREEDPKREEVTLGLLTGDLSPAEIDFPLTGWRENFLVNLAEPLELVNSTFPEEPPLLHGFYIGAMIHSASQVDLPTPLRHSPDAVWRRPDMSEVLEQVAVTMKEFARVESEGIAPVPDESTFATPTYEVPEKYRKIWPAVRWFYEGAVWDDDDMEETAELLPDSIKHPFVPPILMFFATFGLLGGSIWLLVEEFRVSLGWGFGQLGANAASCILMIPGLIVAIIFSCKHWSRARRPVTMILAAFILGVAAIHLVPSWTQPNWEVVGE